MALNSTGTAFLALLSAAIMLQGCQSISSQDQALETMQQHGVLRAGVKFDSRPFGFWDEKHEPQGFDVELVQGLSQRLLGKQGKVEFQQVLSSTRIAAVSSGEVDIVAATMTISPARQRLVRFSRPYFTAHQAVIVPQAAQAKKLSDLATARIGYVYGSNSRTTLARHLPRAVYVGFGTTNEGVSALQNGKLDAFTTDDTILSAYLKPPCRFRSLTDQTLPPEPYGIAMARTGTDSLKASIDKALSDMEHDGTLARLRERWLGEMQHSSACTTP
jgi:putative glutamine transport system substrate-binding protein